MKKLIFLIAIAAILYSCKKTSTTSATTAPKPSSYTVSFFMTDSLFAEHNPSVGIDTAYSFTISNLMGVVIDTPSHKIVYEGNTYTLNTTTNVYSYFDGAYHQVTVTADSIFVYHFWSNAASENHTAHLKGYKK